MGSFFVVIFGITYLVFWICGTKSNIIQGSRNLEMRNPKSWNEKNSEKENLEEINSVERRKWKMDKHLTNYKESIFGRAKTNKKVFEISNKSYPDEVEDDLQMIKSLIKINIQEGILSKYGKYPENLTSFEDESRKFTTHDDIGIERFKMARRKRFLHPDNEDKKIKDNLTQTSQIRSRESISSVNLTCLSNCTVIGQTLNMRKSNSHYVCCPMTSGKCCIDLKNSFGLQHSIHVSNSSQCKCSQEPLTLHQEKGFGRSECIDNYWMITTCSSSWPQDEVSHKCSSASTHYPHKKTLEDLYITVPVFSADGRVFRNRYCAKCNRKDIFEPYKVVFECSTSPPATYGAQKALEYLASHCSTYRYEPQGNQTFQSCPHFSLFCSSRTPRNALSNSTSEKPVQCTPCKGVQTIKCRIIKTHLQQEFETSGTKTFFQTAPLSFAFDLMSDELKPELVKVSCPKENPIYDPYLDECRYGLVPSPRAAAFDSYRFRLFLEDSVWRLKPNLKDFEEYIKEELGFAISKPRYFRKGFQFDVRINQLSNDTTKNYKLESYIHFNNQFNITITNNIKVGVYKVTYRILTCINQEYYGKNEYTVLNGMMPAVYLNKSREMISYFNYYSVENDAIIICRIRLPNCSGVYIRLDKENYTMMGDNSISLTDTGTIYHQNNYEIYNDTLWICVDFPKTFSVFKKKQRTSPAPLSILTFACMCLSITGLVFVLVTYSLFSELRTPPGVNVMNLSASILLAQLLWLLGSGQTDTPMVCTVIAVVLHYLFLVSFVWTSIIAFDTWKAFTTKQRMLTNSKAQRFKHCMRRMAVGWLPVIMYVAICICLNDLDVVTMGYGSDIGCWITNAKAKLHFFVIPVNVFIVANLLFFALTVKAIKQTRSQTKLIANQLVKKQDFGIYVRIASLMGFTWIFGFIAPFGWHFLWYPFVVLNSLQGLYIAIAFGFSKRARKLYIDFYRGQRTRFRNRQSARCSERREGSTKESFL